MLDSESVTVQRGQRGIPCEVLLRKARQDLRCVPWQSLNRELFDSSSCSAETSLELSRAVPSGASIDLFLTHSWRDDAEQKWAALCKAGDSFRTKHHRLPTAWLDKLCIDQNSIADGLRSLSVSLMACDAVLLLFGPFYTSRLWCVWELFTLTAFLPLELAVARVKMAPLNEADLASNALAQQLEDFDAATALTYDPNDRAKLIAVIEAVGRWRFNETIHELGRRVGNNFGEGTATSSATSLAAIRKRLKVTRRTRDSSNSSRPSRGREVLTESADKNNQLQGAPDISSTEVVLAVVPDAVVATTPSDDDSSSDEV